MVAQTHHQDHHCIGALCRASLGPDIDLGDT